MNAIMALTEVCQTLLSAPVERHAVRDTIGNCCNAYLPFSRLLWQYESMDKIYHVSKEVSVLPWMPLLILF